MKRRRWYALAALMLVCAPMGSMVSPAFGKSFLPSCSWEAPAACWFTPARLLMLGALILALTLVHYRSREGRDV